MRSGLSRIKGFSRGRPPRAEARRPFRGNLICQRGESRTQFADVPCDSPLQRPNDCALEKGYFCGDSPQKNARRKGPGVLECLCKLSLGELESRASAFLAVFLTLLHARIAREVAAFAQCEP